MPPASPDLLLVRHLNQAWPRRAAVCAMQDADPAPFDASRPDYPRRLVPFYEHHGFQRLEEPVRSSILTWGWMGYNARTIVAEDQVVNPALHHIGHERLDASAWDFQEALHETLVDEHYHTLMHLRAMQRTRVNRRLVHELRLPPSVTYRRLQSLQAALREPWEQSLAAVAFAVVAEISVNAFLDVLADDEEIQASHRAVAQRHNRDEYAHSKVIAEISKVLYAGLPRHQQAFFIKILPQALRAYLAQDFSMWDAILTQLRVEGASAMIQDVMHQSPDSQLTRDYSGLHRFADELGILTLIDFDFSLSATAATPQRHSEATA